MVHVKDLILSVTLPIKIHIIASLFILRFKLGFVRRLSILHSVTGRKGSKNRVEGSTMGLTGEWSK